MKGARKYERVILGKGAVAGIRKEVTVPCPSSLPFRPFSISRTRLSRNLEQAGGLRHLEWLSQKGYTISPFKVLTRGWTLAICGLHVRSSITRPLENGFLYKQGNKINVNSFCVKQGQGLKNNHSNVPLIAPPASSPGTDIFPKRTPSTAPTGVLIEAGFPIDFFGIREVPYEARDQGIRTSPGIHIFPRRTPGVQLPTVSY